MNFYFITRQLEHSSKFCTKKPASGHDLISIELGTIFICKVRAQLDISFSPECLKKVAHFLFETMRLGFW